MTRAAVFVFDFDGVIADSAPAYAAAINAVGQRMGASVQMDVKMLAGMLDYRHARSAALIGLTSEQVERFSTGLSDYFHREQPLRLFTEMAVLLQQLQDLGSVVILSANEHEVIERALRELGVAVDSIHARRGRDAKAQVLRELSGAARVVMVGDTLSDCIAAKTADVDCVAVSWGWQGRELLSGAQVPVVDSRDELLAHLFDWYAAQ